MAKLYEHTSAAVQLCNMRLAADDAAAPLCSCGCALQAESVKHNEVNAANFRDGQAAGAGSKEHPHNVVIARATAGSGPDLT